MTQPKALRLAKWIEDDMTCLGDAEIAAELRRLHEVNTELCDLLARALPMVTAAYSKGFVDAEAIGRDIEEALATMIRSRDKE